MAFTRRKFLKAGALAPFLASCATNLGRGGEIAPPVRASELGVCAASWVALEAGIPGSPVPLSGCTPPFPVHTDSLFQAASLTKPVTAFAALRLAREGRLDLHAPVSRYLPDGYVHHQDPFGAGADGPVDHVAAGTLARIPVATLLNHTSGLPNWTNGLLAPEFEPSARWQYSGEGYVLLAAVIGAVTGETFEASLSNRVLRPLGMGDSRLRFTDDMRDRCVEGRSSFGWRTQHDFREANAAASLYTTGADYAKLLAALLADGPLLSLTLSNPVPCDPSLGLAWGYGWGIETAAGGPYLWHWGNNPGFRAFAMASVTSGNGFVLFTNSEHGMPLAASLAHTTVPADHPVFRFPMLA